MNLPRKFIRPINNKYVNFIKLCYNRNVQMHVNILYQNKINLYNCHLPEQTALIFKWYNLSWKVLISQSTLIKHCNTNQPHCNITQCHTKSVCTLYETDAVWLWLCIKHPSHEEQRSSIIMHVRRMIDCPGHTNSYIKQQLATRWAQPLIVSDTNHFVLCWLPGTSSRRSVFKTLNLKPNLYTNITCHSYSP